MKALKVIIAAVFCTCGVAAADPGGSYVHFVQSGETWKYLDDGSNQGTNWRTSAFNDSSWDTGAAQFGFGDGDETTVIYYGPNPNNKYITTYFRTRFEVADTNRFSRLHLGTVRDSGCVIFLNGTEIYRSYMPGSWGYLTVATTEPSGDDSRRFQYADIPSAALIQGTNVLAAEVHLRSASDSDMSFDAFLGGYALPCPRAGFWTTSTVSRLSNEVTVADMQGTSTSNFAAVCMGSSNEIFILVSNPPSIQVYSLDGVSGDRTIALTGFSAPKGICRYDTVSNLFSIVEEGSNDITVVAIATDAVSVAKSSGATFDMGVTFPDPDKGIEGLTYNPREDCWYTVREADPMWVCKVQHLGGSRLLLTNIFNAQLIFTNRCFGLTDIHYDPGSGSLFLISGQSRRIYECDLSGNIIGSNNLAGTRPEGVSMSDDGETLFVADSPDEYRRYSFTRPLVKSGQGTAVDLPVTLGWAWTSTVSVAYSVTSDTAVAGVDYVQPGGLLTFSPGVTSNEITIQFLVNPAALSNQMLRVSVSGATNASIGRNSEYDCMILTNEYVLSVSSPHPGASPEPGLHPYYYNAPVTCVVTSPACVHGETQYVCAGWTGTGSTPASGTTTNTGSFIIKQGSSITWLWSTNYWLSCRSDAGGTAIFGNRWAALGSNHTVEAVPLQGWQFDGWSGDTGGANTNSKSITLAITGPADLSAHFRPATNAAGQMDYPLVEFAVTSRIERYSLVYSNTNMPGYVDKNFSGIALMTTTNEMLIALNKSDYFLTSNAAAIQIYDDGGDFRRLIALYGFADIEGICQYKPESNLFAICEEGYGQIAVIDASPGITNVNKSDAYVVSMGLGAPFGSFFNLGIEGVTYDRVNDRFFTVKEKDPMECFRTTTNAGVSTLPLFTPQSAFSNIVTDMADLFYDDHNGRMYILGEEINLLMECDLDGNLLAAMPIPGNQPEGLTMSEDRRTMYVTGEDCELYKYQLLPPSTQAAEGAQVILPVVLSAFHTNTVYADFTVTSTSATALVDFAPQSGTVEFAPGVMTSSVSVSVLFDPGVEGGESFRVTLTNPVNAVLGCDIAYDCAIAANTTRTIRVFSPWGSCLPPAGTNYLPHGATTNCAVVNSPVVSEPLREQKLCTGWTGTGSAPPAGDGTSTPPFVVTQDSDITWLWRTNYWLAVLTNGPGAVTNGNLWLDAWTNIVLLAEPFQYRNFSGWSGDTGGADTNNPSLPLLMDTARTVTASFADQLATNDTPVWWIKQFYPETNDYDSAALGDTDGDGATAWEEYAGGTSPTNDKSVFRIVGMRRNNDGILEILWWSVTNRHYSVFKSTNLLADWLPVPLTSDVPGETYGTNSVLDEDSGLPQMFYRIDAH